MKNSTIIKFIFTFIALIAMIGFIIYAQYLISEKIKLVRAEYIKESQISGFDFGNELRQNIQTVSNQEAIIIQSFISETQVLNFIQAVENVASLSGLTISIDKVERGSEKKLNNANVTLSPVTFTVQVRGAYSETMNFVEQILSNNIKLSIKQFDMYSVTQEGGGIEYNTRLLLVGNILSYE